jgi:predicted ATPase
LHEGRFEEAVTEFDQRMALVPYRKSSAIDMPPHSGAQALAHSAISLAVLGRWDEATTRARTAQERAMQLKPWSMCTALTTLSIWAFIARDLVTLRSMTATLVPLAHEKGYLGVAAAAGCHQGWLLVTQGDVANGLADVRAGVATLDKMERIRWGPYIRLVYSDALSMAKKLTDARSVLDEGLEISARTSETWLDAELHRRRGALMVSGIEADIAVAEDEYRRAIDIARVQSAQLWELRASIDLAKLWIGRNRRHPAHELLAELYGSLESNEETLDLLKARNLLADLGTRVGPARIGRPATQGK